VQTLFILFLVMGGLLVVLWGGGAWLQAQIYSELDPQVNWGAPVAALLLTAFFGFWCWLDSKWPGTYDTLARFSATDLQRYEEFWVPSETDPNDKIHYRLTLMSQGERLPPRAIYRMSSPPYSVWRRSREIHVKEKDGQESVFKASLDKEGRYEVKQGRSLEYRDAKGRIMTEETIGQIATFHYHLLLANLALNFGHFTLWFLCLWLLLRFHFSLALGMAFGCWITATLVLVPMLLDKTREARSPSFAVLLVSASWTADAPNDPHDKHRRGTPRLLNAARPSPNGIPQG
jgi:hypothetical protein